MTKIRLLLFLFHYLPSEKILFSFLSEHNMDIMTCVFRGIKRSEDIPLIPIISMITQIDYPTWSNIENTAFSVFLVLILMALMESSRVCREQKNAIQKSRKQIILYSLSMYTFFLYAPPQFVPQADLASISRAMFSILDFWN